MSAVERLAREILETRRLALGHATAPQLAYGSVDGGRISFRGPNGEVAGDLGVGVDGGISIEHYEGPKPPTPTTPTVKADAGILSIGWDGGFEADTGDEPTALPTSDVDRVEVHASQDENFVPDRVQSFGGSYASLDGGLFALGPLPEAGTWYVRLVARSKAGKYSVPSVRVEQEVAIASVDLAVTDAWLTGEAAQTTADGKNSIWRGPDEPVADPDRPFKDGDIWFEMTEDGKSIPNIWDETTGAWVANDDYRQSEIERVQQELREDLDAVIVDGSGTKNFYRDTMPTDEESSEGDLWFDGSDSNKPYIYQAGQWVTVRDSFSKPAAGDIAIGWGLGAPRDDIFDGQVTTVDGFQFGTDPDNATIATVPSGDGTGTAKLYVPLRGTVTYDGVTVSDGRDPYDAGYPLGWSAIGNLAEGVKFKVASGAPTASLIMWVRAESTGEEATLAYPLDISAYTTSDMTHQALSSETIDAGLGLYPTLVACSFAILFEVPDDPGNYIRGDQIAAYAQLIGDAVSDNAITETKISDDSISTPKLQSKVITTDKIAAGAITAESGIIGSINAGTITVGEMDGARIKAQSIYSDKLLIGGDRNLIPNGDLDKGSAVNWPDTATYREVNGPAGSAHASPNIAFPSGVGYTYDFKNMGTFPVTAGETLVFECWVKSDKAGASVYFTIQDQNGPSTSTANRIERWTSVEGGAAGTQGPMTNFQPGNSWTKVVSKVKVPDGVTSVVMQCAYFNHSAGSVTDAAWYMAGLKLYTQVGATLIEGGAITTEKIAVGAITAESGIIGSIDANVITVGKIMGNQLDADAINGKTITGATIRTASSGSRVELTQNGLKQYNALGRVVTDMSLGQLSLIGDIATGFDGERRVEIKQNLWTDGAGIVFAPEGGSTSDLSKQARVGSPSPGGIVLASQSLPGSLKQSIEASPSTGMILQTVETDTNGTSAGRVGLLNFTQAVSNASQRGILLGVGNKVGTTNYMDAFIAIAGADSSNHWAGIEPNEVKINADAVVIDRLKGETPSAVVDVSAGGFRVTPQNATGDDGRITLRGQDFSYASTIAVTGGVQDLRIYAPGGVYPSLNSGGGTSVVVDAAGQLRRSTSSRQYKDNIEPAFIDDTILGLQPVTFQYKEQIEEYNRRTAEGESLEGTGLSDGAPVSFGLIAEDTADAGVDYLVFRDLEGNPESISYERIGVALIPIVRDLRDRIVELEAQLAAV